MVTNSRAYAKSRDDRETRLCQTMTYEKQVLTKLRLAKQPLLPTSSIYLQLPNIYYAFLVYHSQNLPHYLRRLAYRHRRTRP